MKRFLNLFVLTKPEQRLIIVLVLLLVGGAWYKHHRDLNYSVPPQPVPSTSPAPQGGAISKSPTN
jgi:hypothetical protein